MGEFLIKCVICNELTAKHWQVIAVGGSWVYVCYYCWLSNPPETRKS